MKLNIIKNCLYRTYIKNTAKKLTRTLQVTVTKAKVDAKGRSLIQNLVTRTEDYSRISHDDDNG
jgi:hypothetical protein